MKRRALFLPAAVLTTALAAAPCSAADILVPVAGIVSGSPESVSFSGQAVVSSKLVPDPDFGKPSLLLVIDLSSVSGVGASTKTKYVIAAREQVQRRLAGSHRVEIAFPFTRSGTSSVAPSAGLATFTLDFDVNSGAITRAAGSVATPHF